MGENLIDYERLEQIVAGQAAQYRGASPFPHIVIDDLLQPEVVDYLASLFPPIAQKSEQGAASYLELEDGSRAQEGKHWISRELAVDPAFRRLYWELNSGPFVRFLQRLTGLGRLLPDPYLLGAGLHQTQKGGFLKVHADFSRHPDLQLQRKLNVLIYFNQDWQDEYGGELELWSEDMGQCEQRVVPAGGRCVIFNTTSTSFHGHPQPLTCPPQVTRKSVALYYYRNEAELVDHQTLWQQTN